MGVYIRTSKVSAVSVPFWATPFLFMFFVIYACFLAVAISLAIAFKFVYFTVALVGRRHGRPDTLAR